MWNLVILKWWPFEYKTKFEKKKSLLFRSEIVFLTYFLKNCTKRVYKPVVIENFRLVPLCPMKWRPFNVFVKLHKSPLLDVNQGGYWFWKVLETNWVLESPGKLKNKGKVLELLFSKHYYFLILSFCFIKQKISETVYFSGKSFLWKLYLHELSCFPSCTIECIEFLIKKCIWELKFLMFKWGFLVGGRDFVPEGGWGGGGLIFQGVLVCFFVWLLSVFISLM